VHRLPKKCVHWRPSRLAARTQPLQSMIDVSAEHVSRWWRCLANLCPGWQLLCCTPPLLLS
jgi:hypothetical protein